MIDNWRTNSALSNVDSLLCPIGILSRFCLLRPAKFSDSILLAILNLFRCWTLRRQKRGERIPSFFCESGRRESSPVLPGAAYLRILPCTVACLIHIPRYGIDKLAARQNQAASSSVDRRVSFCSETIFSLSKPGNVRSVTVSDIISALEPYYFRKTAIASFNMGTFCSAPIVGAWREYW